MRIAWWWIIAGSLLGCWTAPAAEILVAAASDLAPAETALRKAFGPGVRFTFGSSGALLRQIENGAPFDVYLSANEQYVADGIRTGALAGPGLVYGLGRIALWSKSGELRALGQLRDPKIRHVAIANPNHAPFGVAAKQALEKAGMWPLDGRIVYAENVRQALQFAESGNAEAAIVSWSLVHGRGGVLLAGVEVRQAAAVVKSSRNREAAERFVKWLCGPAGRQVLGAHGISAPR